MSAYFYQERQFQLVETLMFICLSRYGNSGEISMIVLVFILHHFQEKRMTIFSKHYPETLTLGLF